MSKPHTEFKSAADREEYVRRLRDNIYGPTPKFCTDEGWQATKHNWMRPDAVIWLENQPQNA